MSKYYFRYDGDEQVSKRIGKGNPSYNSGMFCRSSKKTSTGMREFRRNNKSIREKMIDDYGYIKCQHCETSNSIRFDGHHIIFRSEKPMHEYLHKKENIIILCVKCHFNFHKNKGMRNDIVTDRGLDKLFGKDVLNK